MPRRRRRPNDSMRPALTFVESPVHIEHSPPSPVYCSDNPATAKVVPLEELPEWTWVSPQFENRGQNTGLRRRRRNYMTSNSTSVFTRSRARHSAKSPSKYKTLELAPISQKPPTPVQCLNFDNNCDSINVTTKSSDLRNKSPKDSIINENCSRPVTRQRRHLPDAEDQHTLLKKSKRMDSSLLESPCDVNTPTKAPDTKKAKELTLQHLLEFETPKNHLPSNAKVLVYDTPEEEYGLPVRLRNKKYRKRLSTTNTSTSTGR